MLFSISLFPLPFTALNLTITLTILFSSFVLQKNGSIRLHHFSVLLYFLPIVFFLNFCYTENVCVSNSGIALSSCRHIHKLHKRGYLFHGYVCHFKRPGNHYRIRKIVWYSCQKMQGSAGCGRADCRYCPWTQCAGTRSAV